MVQDRFKAFVKQCVGKVGRFLKRPTTIRFVTLLLTSVLVVVLRILIVVLLSMAGIALPVG